MYAPPFFRRPVGLMQDEGDGAAGLGRDIGHKGDKQVRRIFLDLDKIGKIAQIIIR